MNTSAIEDLSNFSQSLYDDTTDGYNQIFKNNSNFKIINVKSKDVFDKLSKLLLNEDVYVQINTTYKPVRCSENIRQFRALYIDIDNQENNECQCFYEVWELSQKGVIPEPSLYIASGRGVHLYWIIENAPYQARHTWQELEDFLYRNLKHLGADKRATDCVRLLRVPGTINSKNNSVCRILSNSNHKYSMYDLREEYLYKNNKKYHQLKIKQTDKEYKTVSNKFFNSYSLHITRAEDLGILCKLRDYDVRGYRNSLIHLYAYWNGIYIRNLEELKTMVINFNNSFKEPLKLNEINSIIKSTDRAVDKFIDYEQGIRSGDAKRVSKAMKERGGYWYSNETLVAMFNISLEEQRGLKTIIGTEEKYRRNNLRRTPRNAEGLTKKQVELKELYVKAKALKDKGLSTRAIAKELNITQAKVMRLFRNNKS